MNPGLFLIVVLLLWGPTAVWLIYRATRSQPEKPKFTGMDEGRDPTGETAVTTLVIEGGYWVCGTCRSVNRPDTSRCYNCRAAAGAGAAIEPHERDVRPMVPVMAAEVGTPTAEVAEPEPATVLHVAAAAEPIDAIAHRNPPAPPPPPRVDPMPGLAPRTGQARWGQTSAPSPDAPAGAAPAPDGQPVDAVRGSSAGWDTGRQPGPAGGGVPSGTAGGPAGSPSGAGASLPPASWAGATPGVTQGMTPGMTPGVLPGAAAGPAEVLAAASSADSAESRPPGGRLSTSGWAAFGSMPPSTTVVQQYAGSRRAQAHPLAVAPVCRYLASRDDATTRFDFPYAGNACHAGLRPSGGVGGRLRQVVLRLTGRGPQPIGTEYQASMCLTTDHVRCPRYLEATPSARVGAAAEATPPAAARGPMPTTAVAAAPVLAGAPVAAAGPPARLSTANPAPVTPVTPAPSWPRLPSAPHVPSSPPVSTGQAAPAPRAAPNPQPDPAPRAAPNPQAAPRTPRSAARPEPARPVAPAARTAATSPTARRAPGGSRSTSAAAAPATAPPATPTPAVPPAAAAGRRASRSPTSPEAAAEARPSPRRERKHDAAPSAPSTSRPEPAAEAPHTAARPTQRRAAAGPLPEGHRDTPGRPRAAARTAPESATGHEPGGSRRGPSPAPGASAKDPSPAARKPPKRGASRD